MSGSATWCHFKYYFLKQISTAAFGKSECKFFFLFNIERHHYTLHKKWSFPIRTSSVNMSKSTVRTDLVTEETLNGKLHFLCSDINGIQETEKYCAYFTFNALRSLSKLCPISMVAGSNRLDRISCISSMVVSTSCKSSFVTPLNLKSNHQQKWINKSCCLFVSQIMISEISRKKF